MDLNEIIIFITVHNSIVTNIVTKINESNFQIHT